MATRDEIIARLDGLPPVEQERVLAFDESLEGSLPKGITGAEFLQFAGTLDDQSAREMMEAIEEEFERIDASQW